MVQAWGDADLAQAASAALAKIHNVLPDLLRREAQLPSARYGRLASFSGGRIGR